MIVETTRKTLPDLPDGPRTRAFRAICAVLRSDPVLATVVGERGWMTRSGLPDDTKEPAEGRCPIVALSPVPRDDRRSSNETATVYMEVAVELYVKGNCVDDILNLWDAVVAAMDRRRQLDGGQLVAEYLRCAIPPGVDGTRPSIQDFQLTTPAFPAYLPSTRVDSLGMTRGLGKIEFNYERRR